MAETFDLIIVGSGIGGLTAALAARSAGLTPLVLEKTDKIGGNSAMSGGVFWAPANHVMARDGVEDSFEEGLKYINNVVTNPGRGSTPERREALIRSSAEVIRFLGDLGIEFRHQPGRSDYYDELPGGSAPGRSLEVDLFDVESLGPWKDKLRLSLRAMPITGREAPKVFLMRRTLSGMLMAGRLGLRMATDRILGKRRVGFGAAMIGKLLQACIRRGIEIRVSSPAHELIAEDNKVCGVVVTENGQPAEIRSRHGVLIASGGFGRNKEMRDAYLPHPTTTDWTLANPGETGDMIVQARSLGAAVDHMDQVIGMAVAIMPDAGAYPVYNEMSKPFGIVVDQGGKRFCDECGSYMEVIQRMYERNRTTPAVPSWLIMDARFRRFYTFATVTPGKIPSRWIETGFMRANKTLSGLAADCGIDPEGLEETVERFNGFAREGVDRDYGRGGRHYDRFFGDPTVKPNPSLGPIEQGPFMAVAIYPGDVGTYGGLVADQHARVLREDGSVIEGLFATGTTTAPVTGACYPGAGASISASAAFGYIAALYCATQGYATRQ